MIQSDPKLKRICLCASLIRAQISEENLENLN
jgi:hypothetical protein